MMTTLTSPREKPLLVIKLSGKVVSDASALQELAQGLYSLSQRGFQLVIVHGGGNQLDDLAERLNISQSMIAGRRVTCAQTRLLAMMVFGGQVNLALTASLRSAGISPVGLSGIDGELITAKRRPPKEINDALVDFGYVGDLISCNPQILWTLLAAGHTPVICSLVCDVAGEILNVNADTIASTLAAALKAQRLIMLSDTSGIYEDPKDPASLFPRLSLEECHELLKSGRAYGGMLPKLAAVITALEHGVNMVHLLDGRVPQTLADVLLQNIHSGTLCTQKLPLSIQEPI